MSFTRKDFQKGEKFEFYFLKNAAGALTLPPKKVQVNHQILRIKAGALREFFDEKSPTTGAG